MIFFTALLYLPTHVNSQDICPCPHLFRASYHKRKEKKRIAVQHCVPIASFLPYTPRVIPLPKWLLTGGATAKKVM